MHMSKDTACNWLIFGGEYYCNEQCFLFAFVIRLYLVVFSPLEFTTLNDSSSFELVLVKYKQKY